MGTRVRRTRTLRARQPVPREALCRLAKRLPAGHGSLAALLAHAPHGLRRPPHGAGEAPHHNRLAQPPALLEDAAGGRGGAGAAVLCQAGALGAERAATARPAQDPGRKHAGSSVAGWRGKGAAPQGALEVGVPGLELVHVRRPDVVLEGQRMAPESTQQIGNMGAACGARAGAACAVQVLQRSIRSGAGKAPAHAPPRRGWRPGARPPLAAPRPPTTPGAAGRTGQAGGLTRAEGSPRHWRHTGACRAPALRNKPLQPRLP